MNKYSQDILNNFSKFSFGNNWISVTTEPLVKVW